MASQNPTTAPPAEASRPAETATRWQVADLPEESVLSAVLSDVLRAGGLVEDRAVVVQRSRAGRYSTYPNEVVRCRLGGGGEILLLCKYARGRCHSGFGHRRGVEYETLIYRDVLAPLGLSTPRYYGCHADAATGDHWLVIEFLDGATTANKGPQPASIRAAAAWSGDFHARCGAGLGSGPVPSLIAYDGDYYRGWGRRALEFTRPLHGRHPWLPDLCRRYEGFVDALLALPRGLVHGEYTVHNVLLRDGVVSPIDWESAALAVPEIDLAMIIDGTWPVPIQEMCVGDYQRARWGEAVPGDFRDRLRAGQLYNHFRWLGSRAKDTTLEKNAFRYDHLRSVAEQMRLI